jgi:hypothetical protein
MSPAREGGIKSWEEVFFNPWILVTVLTSCAKRDFAEGINDLIGPDIIAWILKVWELFLVELRVREM